MKAAKQWIHTESGELVNVDMVRSIRIDAARAHLTLVGGVVLLAPYPLQVAALPTSLAPGAHSDQLRLAETRTQRTIREGRGRG